MKTEADEIRNLAEFLQENPDPILRASAEGAVSYANQAAIELLEAMGWQAGQPLPEELLRPAQGVLAGGETGEFDLLRPAGRTSLVAVAAGRGTGQMNLYARDVTECRRAEDAARLTAETFEKTFQGSAAPMVLSRIEDGCVLDVNDRWLELRGFRREEVVGQTTVGLSLWKDPAERAAIAREVREKGFVRGRECVGLCKDGREWTGLFSFQIITIRGQQVLVSSSVDITERKRAEEALQQAHAELEQRVKERTEELTKANEHLLQAQDFLQESETRYRELIENQGEGLGIVDPRECFTFANPAAEQIFGVPRGSLPGRSLREFMTPDQYARVLEQTKKRQAGEKTTYELEIVRPSGETRCLLVTAVPRIEHTGEFAGTFGLFFDVTERKHAEEALRQSHDELRAIYDGMTDGIAIVDVETDTPVRANAALCQMLGYSDEGAETAAIRLCHPPEAEAGIEDFIRTVAKGGVQRFANMPFLRKDGSVCYADVITRQMLYDGRLCRMSCLHDTTERKQAEEALRKAHRNLKRLLHSSDHERQLIAFEIHDGLAQHLTAALLELQAFDHVRSRNPKEAAKAYDAAMTMLQQGHYEARRLIAGLRPPILDDSGVVEAVAHLVHEQGRGRGPEIAFHSSVEFDRLDPTLENAVYRIAQEALTNACKHGKSKRISVSLRQRADRLRIEIRDWGVGFDPKAVPKSRFGLEGIRQRAKLLGGKCRIRSAAGAGTRVRVELPVVPRGKDA